MSSSLLTLPIARIYIISTHFYKLATKGVQYYLNM
jgi:hypothetical protein